MKIDIFCEVIDYFGDIAVAYRLALALKQLEPTLHIRFFCSHPNTLLQLYPAQHNDAIPLLAYHQSSYSPSDVALEAFGCQLPTSYPNPRLIINLEYLSAEQWVAGFHGLESLGMNPNGKKYFFFPSFSASGGITHGAFLQQKTACKSQSQLAKQQLMKELALPPNYLERPWLLLYLYQLDAECYQELLTHFAVIQIGQLGQMDDTHNHPWLAVRRCASAVFDQLLLSCEASLIRGEDSLSRAVLAGKPFLWQAYRQEEGYHLVKVQALSDHFEQQNLGGTHQNWARLQRQLNEENRLAVGEFVALGNDYFVQMAQQASLLPSLEVNLLSFMQHKLIELG
jgi:hypothetical protein